MVSLLYVFEYVSSDVPNGERLDHTKDICMVVVDLVLVVAPQPELVVLEV